MVGRSRVALFSAVPRWIHALPIGLLLASSGLGVPPTERFWREPATVLLTFTRGLDSQGYFGVEAFVQANVPIENLRMELETLGKVRLKESFAPDRTSLPATGHVQFRSLGRAVVTPGELPPGLSFTVTFDFPFEAMRKELALHPPRGIGQNEVRELLARMEALKGQPYVLHASLPIEPLQPPPGRSR